MGLIGVYEITTNLRGLKAIRCDPLLGSKATQYSDHRIAIGIAFLDGVIDYAGPRGAHTLIFNHVRSYCDLGLY